MRYCCSRNDLLYSDALDMVNKMFNKQSKTQVNCVIDYLDRKSEAVEDVNKLGAKFINRETIHVNI